jgi:hypothetical protein
VCPKYSAAQHQLQTNLKTTIPSIRYLLLIEDRVKHLLKYIKATERFQHTLMKTTCSESPSD